MGPLLPRPLRQRAPVCRFVCEREEKIYIQRERERERGIRYRGRDSVVVVVHTCPFLLTPMMPLEAS